MLILCCADICTNLLRIIPINACPKAAYISRIIVVFITVLHMHLLPKIILVTSVLYTTTRSNAEFLRVLYFWTIQMNSIPILIHHIHNYYSSYVMQLCMYHYHYLTIVLVVRHLSVEYTYCAAFVMNISYARIILCTFPLKVLYILDI